MFGMQMGFGQQMPMGTPMMGMGMPGMIGMGGMSPMLNMQMMNEMFVMMQMMTMMQMAQRMAGQQTGAFMGGMPGGGMGGYQFPSMGGMQGMPWGGMGGYGFPGGMMAPTGPVPYNEVTGNRLADQALAWNGRHFKPGQTKRCADFVSTVIEQSGQAPPGFRHQMSCDQLQRYGRPVGKEQLKPGDVVFFGNTYRPGQFTHTGIYLGNGKFAHRPTSDAPVRVDNLNSGYYANKFSGGRRLNA